MGKHCVSAAYLVNDTQTPSLSTVVLLMLVVAEGKTDKVLPDEVNLDLVVHEAIVDVEDTLDEVCVAGDAGQVSKELVADNVVGGQSHVEALAGAELQDAQVIVEVRDLLDLLVTRRSDLRRV